MTYFSYKMLFLLMFLPNFGRADTRLTNVNPLEGNIAPGRVVNKTNNGFMGSVFNGKPNYATSSVKSGTRKECVMIVSGRVGANDAINGDYAPDTFTDGKQDYHNSATGLFLYWHIEYGAWLIGPLRGSTILNAANFADVITPDLLTTAWQVSDGTGFVIDPNVEVKCDEGVDACMVEIEGRVGVNALMNGFYELLGITNGRPDFYHIINGGFLYWNEVDSGWAIGPELGSNMFAAINFDNVPTPDLVTLTWQVFDGISFVLDDLVQINCLSQECHTVLEGRVGVNSLINGFYLGNSMTDGRPNFFNILSNYHLYWNAETEAWVIGRELGSTNVVAVNRANVLTPDQLTTHWEVSDGVEFIPDSLVQLRCDVLADYQWFVQTAAGDDCYSRCTRSGLTCADGSVTPHTEDEMMLISTGIITCLRYELTTDTAVPFQYIISLNGITNRYCRYGVEGLKSRCSVRSSSGTISRRYLCPCL